MEDRKPVWRCDPVSATAVQRLTHELGVSELLARLLVRRGLETTAEARQFLSPRLRSLRDPNHLHGLREVVTRLERAVERQEGVLVFGDYDVDGITSTAILTHLLRRLGLAVTTFIPNRLEDGYGLTPEAATRALERCTPQLLIAVDCGTHCDDVRPLLSERGIDLVVIDHHAARGELTPMETLVNPNALGGEGAQFSAAGLAFKVAHGLLKRLSEKDPSIPDRFALKDDLDLVALGTIADIVPLTEENRILVRAGMKVLSRRQRPGLAALLDVSGIDREHPPTISDVNFRLGPRLNASGRLAEASLPLELLLTEDTPRAHELARQLDELNKSRQRIEGEIFQEALEQAQSWNGSAGIVVHAPGWHLGVLGIVASRLVQTLGVPCLVLGDHARDNLAHGSGRSVTGANLVEILGECGRHLHRYGGHPMAAGLSLAPENLSAFRETFAEAAAKSQRHRQQVEEVRLEAWLSLAELSERVHQEIEKLQPFGNRNANPLLGIRRVRLADPPDPLGERHIRFHLQPRIGRAIPVIGWNGAENPPPHDGPVDLAVRSAWNIWRGRRTARFELQAWRRSPAQS